jgi:hypothetical protein
MADKIIELYRPSNGTEGECFISHWCGNCARDKAMSEGLNFDDCDDEQVCKIIGDTMHYNIDDPEYPREWNYDASGSPQCTAFIEVGKPIPFKDELTMDLFA